MSECLVVSGDVILTSSYHHWSWWWWWWCWWLDIDVDDVVARTTLKTSAWATNHCWLNNWPLNWPLSDHWPPTDAHTSVRRTQC